MKHERLDCPYDFTSRCTMGRCDCKPKQETLEEGAKWRHEQDKNKYSEEEVNEMFNTLKTNSVNNVATITNVDLFISSWKKQFKNK